MVKIAVVGAGIIGLSTAVCLQGQFPEAEVTIIAESWYLDTTSNVAAGIFRPDHVLAKNPTDVPKWIANSAQHYWDLYASRDAAVAGVFELGGYIFSNDDPDLPEAKQYRDFVPNYRRLSGRELDKFGGPWRYGSYHSTLVIEPRIYMRHLGREFAKGGGAFLSERVEDLRNLHGRFEIVCNCSGIGAKILVGDENLVPVRGQVVHVKAPWLKEFFMAENSTYIYPNSERVVLGGTRETGQWDTTISNEKTQTILERCSKILPALHDAEILDVLVGLRPWRPTIRLEREFFSMEGDKNLPVIHNYGHAGNGIALSWGCGVAAANLVQELLT